MSHRGTCDMSYQHGGHLAHGWAKCHALRHCMTWVDRIFARKTHGLTKGHVSNLSCVGVLRLTQT